MCSGTGSLYRHDPAECAVAATAGIATGSAVGAAAGLPGAGVCCVETCFGSDAGGPVKFSVKCSITGGADWEGGAVACTGLAATGVRVTMGADGWAVVGICTRAPGGIVANVRFAGRKTFADSSIGTYS